MCRGRNSGIHERCCPVQQRRCTRVAVYLSLTSLIHSAEMVEAPQTERHRFADLHSRIDRAFAGLPGA